MTISAIDASQRQAAKAAGLAYVLIIILSMLKLIFVGNLIVPGKDAATSNNIMTNERCKFPTVGKTCSCICRSIIHAEELGFVFTL